MNMWVKEFTEARDNKAAILSRLRFHGSLTIGMVVEEAGLCRATVRKHFFRLIGEGKARVWRHAVDCIAYIPENL